MQPPSGSVMQSIWCYSAVKILCQNLYLVACFSPVKGPCTSLPRDLDRFTLGFAVRPAFPSGSRMKRDCVRVIRWLSRDGPSNQSNEQQPRGLAWRRKRQAQKNHFLSVETGYSASVTNNGSVIRRPIQTLSSRRDVGEAFGKLFGGILRQTPT